MLFIMRSQLYLHTMIYNTTVQRPFSNDYIVLSIFDKYGLNESVYSYVYIYMYMYIVYIVHAPRDKNYRNKKCYKAPLQTTMND